MLECIGNEDITDDVRDDPKKKFDVKPVNSKDETKKQTAMITLRKALLKDRVPIQTLHRESVLRVCAPFYSIEGVKIWIDPMHFSEKKFPSLLDHYEVWVAVDQDHEVVGFSQMAVDQTKHTAYLERLYVDPSRLGQGVGSSLLRKQMDRCQEEKVVRLELDATVTAKEFYLKQGFQPKPNKIYYFSETQIGMEVIPMSYQWP